MANTVNGNSGANLMYGGLGGDFLIGGAGNDTLYGEGGNDFLQGGDGNDLLIGSIGADELTGGAGADIFEFDTLTTSADRDKVKDFNPGEDLFLLSSQVFTGLAPGSLPAAAFVNGTQATSSAHRLIYQQVTGNLFYDADWVGGADSDRTVGHVAGAEQQQLHDRLISPAAPAGRGRRPAPPAEPRAIQGKR